MKKVIVFMMLALIVTTSTTSCESNTYKEVATVTNPTYSKNIGPLFNSQCASCHKNDLQFPNLTSYEEVKDGIVNGNVICLIDNPSDCFYSEYMPQTGRMPQTTIDMVKLWVTNGFPN